MFLGGGALGLLGRLISLVGAGASGQQQSCRE
jgi:hypothetical protein